MADWGFANFADDDNDEENEDGQFQSHWGTRDGLIFLIDCNKEMFDENSLFQKCIKCALTTLQHKIISSDKDCVGVVFFGTEKINGEFKNVYILQDLDQPGAERIMELEVLEDEGVNSFDQDYGHSSSFSLSEALWTCSNMFANCSQKINSKRVMLFTNNDDPHASNTQLQRQARTKASDLNENGIDLELMHLNKPGESFDISKFYKDLLFTADDELTMLPDSTERLEELLLRVRTKDHKKRAMSHLKFTMGDGLNFSVGVYNLVRSCPKPYPVKLSKKDNQELKSHTKTYLKDTGEVLMPQDMMKAQTYGNRQICFENDEVNEIKHFDESGLVLMGFKPRSCLKRYFHVKPAQFLYPDEHTVSGSTTLFSALLWKCLDRDVVPVCRYIPRKNTPPKFVILLPQEEETNDSNVQSTAPGFHVIFLPFADDFRKVTYDQDSLRASTEQIDKAKDVIKKLQFSFNPDNFENPVLQQHWSNVEALALDRDAPESITDYTLADDEKIEKRAGKVLAEFSSSVFPIGYAPGNKKRGPAGGGGAVKKPKTENIAPIDIDMKKEAELKRLGKLTVVVLKEFIKKENIKPYGQKKPELIAAINDYFGIG